MKIEQLIGADVVQEETGHTDAGRGPVAEVGGIGTECAEVALEHIRQEQESIGRAAEAVGARV